jgi:hypothetical protein
MKKLIAFVTTLFFLFSSVLSPAVEAIVTSQRDSGEFKQLLSDFAIPSTIGRITAGQYFGSGRIVINVQDLHCHTEVQRNISKILTLLDEKYALKRVFVEGAYGDVDTSWLCNMNDKGLKRGITETLVDEGKLTGTEYYSVVSNKPNVLKGIEDKALHQGNIKRLGRILEKEGYYKSKLDELNHNLDYMKAKYFSSENMKFNRLIAKYRAGDMAPAQYFGLLNKYVDKINNAPDKYNALFTINRENYPNLEAYVELLDTARQLRYKSISNQLQEFVQVLKQRLPYSAYSMLLQKTDNFSRRDELYGYLSKIAVEYKFNLNVQFPELQKFFVYVGKNQKINPLQLIEEEKRLVEDIRIGFSRDVSELDVSFLADFYGYFQDYLLNKLAADDYAYFMERFDKFQQVWGKYAPKNGIAELSGDFSLLNEYYNVNCERNNSFIKNILASSNARPVMPVIAGTERPDSSQPLQYTEDIKATIQSLDKAQEIFVVVAGGFHTAGLEKLLAERKISYLAITPNVTRDTRASSLVYAEFAKQQAMILSHALALGLASQLSSDVLAGLALKTANSELRKVPFTKENINALAQKIAEATKTTVKVESIDEAETKAIISIDGKSTVILAKSPETGMAGVEKVVSIPRIGATIKISFDSLIDFIKNPNYTTGFLNLLAGGAYPVVKNLFAFAAENDIILGDGLIYELNKEFENDPAIKDIDGIKKEILGRFPEQVQDMIWSHATRERDLNDKAQRNELLRILLAIDLLHDAIIASSEVRQGRSSGTTLATSAKAVVVTLVMAIFLSIITPAFAARDIFSEGAYNQYSSSQWKAKAGWYDFSNPVSLKKGDKLRITYTLSGSNVMGVQLKPVGEDDGVKGDMQVIRNVGGSKTIEIPVPSDMDMKRLAFQIGENAWGPLGGSMGASIKVKSIEVVSGKEKVEPRAQQAPKKSVLPAVVHPTDKSARPVSSDVQTPSQLMQQIVAGIKTYINPATGLPVSHVGMKQMEDWGFTYDAAVAALSLRIGGDRPAAERILDAFSSPYVANTADQLFEMANVEGFYGFMRVFKAPFGPHKGKNVKLFVSAVSTKKSNASREWKVGPGPNAWLANAMLEVNGEKYRVAIESIAEGLMALQGEDGGFRRGFDNEADNLSFTDTEPHMDAVNLMWKLWKKTGKPEYEKAYADGMRWFSTRALKANESLIYQGVSSDGKPNYIHATDVYTWPLSMIAGMDTGYFAKNHINIKNLISTVERKSLVQITYTKPDGTVVTVIGVDFADPNDPEAKRQRAGYHPMATPEWMGGMILMYETLAVHFYNEGDKEYAAELKAKAEAMRDYYIQLGTTKNGVLTGPYATAKWLPTVHGWNTPASDFSGIYGFLNLTFDNPFAIHQDSGFEGTLGRIPSLPLEKGRKLLGSALKNTPYTEKGGVSSSDKNIDQPWISEDVLKQAFDAYNKDDFNKAILLAQKGVSNWGPKAREQQKLKDAKYGDIIESTWGRVRENDGTFTKIYAYPALNEVGAFEWILAASYYKKGDIINAKKHIKELVDEYSLAQIWDPSGPGFWSPVVSWRDNPANKSLDAQMGVLYREVVSGKDVGLKGKPKPQVSEKATVPAKVAGTATDILSKGKYNEYSSSEWKAKAGWYDFSTLVSLKKGDKVRITYTLSGSNVMGVQLKDVNEGDGDKGDMQVINDAGGGKTIEVTVPSDRNMRRLAFQIGENAWGSLGGSMGASIKVTRIEIVHGPGAHYNLRENKHFASRGFWVAVGSLIAAGLINALGNFSIESWLISVPFFANFIVTMVSWFNASDRANLAQAVKEAAPETIEGIDDNLLARIRRDIGSRVPDADVEIGLSAAVSDTFATTVGKTVTIERWFLASNGSPEFNAARDTFVAALVAQEIGRLKGYGNIRTYIYGALFMRPNWISPIVTKILGVIDRMAIGTGRNAENKEGKVPSYITWHTGLRSGLDEAIRKFGATTMDSEGNVHTHIYVLNELQISDEEAGLQNTGLSVNGKPIWLSVRAGAMVAYAKGQDPYAIIQVFKETLIKKGFFGASKRGLKRLRDIAGPLNAELIKGGQAAALQGELKTGIVIDGLQIERPVVRYEDNGMTNVAKRYFEEETPGRETGVAPQLGELIATRHAKAVSISVNVLMHMDSIENINDFKKHLEVSNLAGNGQIIVKAGVLANLAKKTQRSIAELAKANGVRVFIDVTDIRPEAREEMIEGFQKMGYAGYAVMEKESVFIKDFFMPDGKTDGVEISFNSANELKTNMRNSKATWKVLRQSTFNRLLRGEVRSITDRIELAEMLKSLLLSLYDSTILTEDFAAGVGYSWNREQLPPLPENKNDLIAAVQEGNAGVIRKAMGSAGQQYSIDGYMKELQAEAKDPVALEQLKKAFLTAIVVMMLAKAALRENGIKDGLADKKLERILGVLLLQQQLRHTEGEGAAFDADAKVDELQRELMQREGIKEAQSANAMFTAISTEITGEFAALAPALKNKETSRGVAQAINGLIGLIATKAEPRMELQKEGMVSPAFTPKSIDAIMKAG